MSSTLGEPDANYSALGSLDDASGFRHWCIPNDDATQGSRMEADLVTNTYGTSGNRWWVGLNTGSSSSFSFADSGGPGNGYQAIPSGNASDDTQFAQAAAYNKSHVSAPNTISVENILWYNITGPYTSQSAAQQAISGVQAQNPAPGLGQQFNLPNVTAPFTDVAHAMTALYDAVTNGKMWRSLGWLLLGGLLILLGLVMLGLPAVIRKTPAGIASKVVGSG